MNADATILRWDERDEGLPYSPTHGLDAWAGERLDLVVGPDQAALLVDGDVVHSVLLEGNHHCCVLRSGEEPGDLSDVELADRLRIEREDVGRAKLRLRMVHAEWSLVFLALDSLPVEEFGALGTTSFADPDHGIVQIDVAGAFRLQTTDPVAFYESFLRNTDDLAPADFRRIAVALVQGGVGHALAEHYECLDDIERDLGVLSARIVDCLRPSLDRVGLALDQFEVTRLHTPVGLAKVDIETSDAATVEETTASLATSKRRG